MITKNRIIILIIAAGIALIVISVRVLYPKPSQTYTQPQTQITEASPANEEPKIISTKPNPLNEAIIAADQIIEITFNRSLQNAPEFKVRIDPKIEFKVELSSDRKTARIIPLKPYELGAAYTLYVNPDTKFDGAGDWGKSQDFHFRTIRYRGI